MRIDSIAYMERAYRITLKKACRDEYVGACPLECRGQGKDRFHVWQDTGNYWCRVCGAKGWVDELSGERLSPEERRLRHIEVEQARQARRQRELEKRLSAMEQMARCQDHIAYHRALDNPALEHWFKQGMTPATIDKYLLGWCRRCPMARNGSSSWTIPIINRGKLENIRHRLVQPDGGKYRPHISGLPLSLFGADILDQATERIIIAEGEVKTIILNQSGFDAVGITGKRAFRREWLERFDNLSTVYVILDPDASESAHKLAAMFGGRGRVVEMPTKIDDMIVRHRASASDIEMFLKWARPIKT